MLISFIIPVYNAEKYLFQCVSSILNSKFIDYEILLINDGSLDNSYKVMQELARQHDAIRIFDKPNGGASSARNIGLDNSKGYYICFVDSDDYILDGEQILKIEKVLNLKDLDILLLDTPRKTKHIKKNISNKDMVFLATTTDVLRGPVSKFYRASLMSENNIRFDESMRMGEDTNFNIRFSKFVQSGLYISYNFYYYRHNPNSLTNTFNMDIFDNRIKNFYAQKSLLAETGYCEFVKPMYCMMINSLALSFLKLYKFDKKECKKLLKSDKYAGLVDSLLKKVKLKDFIFKYKIFYMIIRWKSMILLSVLSRII